MIKQSHMDVLWRDLQPLVFFSEKYVETCQIESERGGAPREYSVWQFYFPRNLNSVENTMKLVFFSKFIACLERNPSNPKTENLGRQ